MGEKRGEAGIAPEPGEKLEPLEGGLWILQPAGRVRFGMDAVALAHFTTVRAGERGLDMGAGTGVVALLIAAREPRVKLTALEIVPAMARRAARSVAYNGLEGRVTVLKGDLRREPCLLPEGAFDFIICNPPYYRLGEGAVSPDPAAAAARHEVFCTLDDVITAAARLAAPRGRLSMVLPIGRREEALALLAAAGWGVDRLRTLHARPGMPALRVLVESVRGPGRRLQEPPLCLAAQEDTP